MSGAVIAVPILPIAIITVGVVAGVPAACYGVAAGVKAFVDNRVEAANRKIEEEKAQLRQWQDYQGRQRGEMEDMARLQSQLRQAEAELASISIEIKAQAKACEEPTTEGYTKLGLPKAALKEAQLPIVTQITSVMESLPEAFQKSSTSPFARLLKQWFRLKKAVESNRPPSMEELFTFRQTVQATLNAYCKSVELEAKQRKDLCARLDGLLSEVLLCRELSSDPKSIESLESLKMQITAIADTGIPKPGHVEFIEKRFVEIKRVVEAQLSQYAFRAALAESIVRNLHDLGYNTVKEFVHPATSDFSQADMAIPGGERLMIAIHRDNSLAFEVIHESFDPAESMTAEDIALFRQQEKLWCSHHLPEIMRRMTAEGFTYRIDLEQLAMESSIPVVRVDTAEELLAEEEEMTRFQDDDERRYMK